MSEAIQRQDPSVSEVTRRNIFDALTLKNVQWSGRLKETEFLSRLCDLKSLPSRDSRYKTAEADIRQHRENNNDWNDDWVFRDSRFNLLRGTDEVFLRFLCEMVHPVVCPDETYAVELVGLCNKYLAHDGWELVAFTDISGKPVYAGRRLVDGAGFGVKQAQRVAAVLDTSYFSRQITRMGEAVTRDPELAIGTAKEFIETICKTILEERGVDAGTADTLPRLVKATMKELELAPDNVPAAAHGADTIRVMLSNLATVASGVTELRNLHGSGHGKLAKTAVLEPRYARLAVGAATALGVFLFETFQAREQTT